MAKSKITIVQDLGDFPTPSGGVITLADDVTYKIEGLVNIGTNTIALGVSNTIFGDDKSSDGLIYTGSSSFINGTNKSFTLRFLTIVANTAGASVFNITNTTDNCEIAENIFGNCKSLGTINGGKFSVFRNNLITSCATGITFTGTIDNVSVTDNIFYANTGAQNNINISSATISSIIIARNNFNVIASQIAINYSTVTINNSGLLSTNIFEGVGTYLSGINQSTTKWLFTANNGIANRVREFFISVNDMSGIALSSPTTSAALAGTLSATGARFLTLRGGNNQDDGLAFTMQVPSDYFSGGRFDIQFTTQTTTSNVKFFLGLADVLIGSDFGTLTESPLSVVIQGATQYQRKEAQITPITTVFHAGDIVVVKVWRDPDDAQDTATVDAYINNIQFVYNSI